MGSTSAEEDEACLDNGMLLWEKLPLEVYETLVDFLDGKSLLNLCMVSPSMAKRILEPFDIMSTEKQEKHWKEFCLTQVYRPIFTKIFRSFVDYDKISWTDLHRSYSTYWMALTEGDATSQRLMDLENKMKTGLFCAKQVLSRKSDYWYSMTNYNWTTFAAGGNLILNIMFPCPKSEKMMAMMVTKQEGVEVEYKHVQPDICRNAQHFLGVRLVDLMFTRKNEAGGTSFDVDRVVLAACEKGITSAPLLGGGPTLRISWPEEPGDPEYRLRYQCPIFEIHDNVVALWSLQESLLFYLLVETPQHGYTFCNLYRVPYTEKMKTVYKEITEDPLQYLPMIVEFNGTTDLMNPRAKQILEGGSDYFYSPHRYENCYYGLALISPTRQSKLIRPDSTHPTQPTIISEYEPIYECELNADKYREQMLEPTCSGKGETMRVFCSATAIAVSWKAKVWLFGELSFPTIDPKWDKSQNIVSHVEVTHFNNGLMLVINEDIILAELERKQIKVGEKSMAEVEVKPLRLIQTGLTTLGREITQIQLDFDQGRPFFLVITKIKEQEEEEDEDGNDFERVWKRKTNYDFSIMRIGFKSQ